MYAQEPSNSNDTEYDEDINQTETSQTKAPTVIIDPGGVGPNALRSINNAVSAITRLSTDQDGGELSRLRRRAHQATVSALSAQGYFTPVVTLEVGEDIEGEAWDVIIEPGPRTVVNDVNIEFKGQITQAEFKERVKNLRESWSLKPEQNFINNNWSSAKDDLISEVSKKDFYFARYRSTKAKVKAHKATADLALEVSSGPRVRMGEVQVNGLERVPRSLVDRYIKYETGEPYDLEKLQKWQEDLNSTVFFRGAFVTMDARDESQKVLENDEIQLPVWVRVTESPARNVRASLGADSDHGARVEALYQQNVVFGKAVQLETGLGIDKKRQRFFMDFHLPPSVKGYNDSLGFLAQKNDIEGVKNSRVALGWKRFQRREAASDSRVDYQTRLGLIVAYDDTSYKGAESFTVPTVIGSWQWIRRDVNDIYDPREGNLIEFGTGLGLTLDKSEPFYRTNLRAQKWFEVGKRDIMTIRAEAGKVWSSTERLPDDFGYRTGGSKTIRGYRFNSIGTKRGAATIGANTMAVAGIEYTRFVTPDLGINFFVDVGDAAPKYKDMKWHLGYGLGATYRTPAGPFSIDLAYGQKDKKLRLHFLLGIAF